MRPVRSSATWLALVGPTRPERLADGATNAARTAVMRAGATSCAGTRSASESSPARASRATRVFGAGATMVSGPGQKVLASFFARSSNSASSSASSPLGEVGDQRIEARPPLGGVDRRDRDIGGREPGEPIDRFGRHRDEPARLSAASRHASIALRCRARENGSGEKFRPWEWVPLGRRDGLCMSPIVAPSAIGAAVAGQAAAAPIRMERFQWPISRRLPTSCFL